MTRRLPPIPLHTPGRHPGRRVFAAARRHRTVAQARHTETAMRTRILDAARELYSAPDADSHPPTLDEVAATAGITARQLRAYYTSVTAIERDLTPPPPPAPAPAPEA
jgi:hypothetical protein